MLKAAPDLKILAASRVKLNLQGEQLFQIAGLDFPIGLGKPGEDAVEYDAVKLFLQSARRVDFELTADDNLEAIIRICQLVHGMPLAIILAAAWVGLLTPAEIADEISHSLDFLETESRDVPERQRSIQVIFDHSWRLLSEPEREVFQQMTVFQGGFSREAAEAVTGTSLRLMMSLVNKSLLQRELTGRFEVHELLRQYGADKLAADTAQETTVRNRHCTFYCASLGQLEANLKGAGQLTALTEIEADLENAHLAWTWAIDTGYYEPIEQALESLYEFYYLCSRFRRGHDDFSRAVARIQAEIQTSTNASGGLSEIVLTKLLARQGAFNLELDRYESASNLLQQSLAMARRLEILPEQAFCLNFLGDIEQAQGKYTEAEKLYQESLTIGQTIGDPLVQAASLEKWGWMKFLQGNYDQAFRLYQQSLNLYREVEHQFGMNKVSDRMALVAWAMGRYPDAEQLWTESLAISRKLRSSNGIARAFGGLGNVAWGLGGSRLVQAIQLHQDRLAITRELGHPVELAYSYCLLAHSLNDSREYQEARKSILEALTISKRISSPFSISWSLSILGETSAGLKDFQAAWKHCYEALKIAVESQAQPIILTVVVHLAFLQAKDTDRLEQETVPNQEAASINFSSERAIEMLTLAMNHPITWQVYKDKAARLRTELEAELPPEMVIAAQERGKSKTLEELIAEILKEKEYHVK